MLLRKPQNNELEQRSILKAHLAIHLSPFHAICKITVFNMKS